MLDDDGRGRSFSMDPISQINRILARLRIETGQSSSNSKLDSQSMGHRQTDPLLLSARLSLGRWSKKFTLRSSCLPQQDFLRIRGKSTISFPRPEAKSCRAGPWLTIHCHSRPCWQDLTYKRWCQKSGCSSLIRVVTVLTLMNHRNNTVEGTDQVDLQGQTAQSAAPFTHKWSDWYMLQSRLWLAWAWKLKSSELNNWFFMFL